jgi:tight adherence protein B
MTVSFALMAALLALISLCGVLLCQDGRQRRIDRQLANALALDEPIVLQAATPAPQAGRFQAHQRAAAFLLRVLLNYTPDMPGHWPIGRTMTAALLVGLTTIVAGAQVCPLWVACLAGLFDGVVTARLLLLWQRRRYADRLLRQLPDAIEIITSAVRAGLPVTEAFAIIGREMDEPSRGEYRRVCGELALGRLPDEALRVIHQRTGVEEYAIFAVTLAVQSKSGGRLAETLQTLSDAIRERIALAGRAKALAGEASLSARVLAALPIISCVVMYFERPDAFALMFHDPRGQKLFAAGMVSLVLGIFTMRRMIRKGTTV